MFLPLLRYSPKPATMKLLCIDTALASCSVCVFDGRVLASEQLFMERGHAEALPPMVARVMAEANCSYSSLHRIAVTTGPGTFTGIRIGLSFARALGLAKAIPVLGINSLKATQVAVSESQSDVVVVHKGGASGFYYVLAGDVSANIELSTLETLLEALPAKSLTIIGTGAADVVAAAARSDLYLAPEHDLPSAAGFATYAASQPEPTGMPDPVYLREADAKPQATKLRALGGLKITVAGPSKIPILARLHGQCFEAPWDSAELTKLLEGHGAEALLAEADDGPVGFIIHRAILDEAEIITVGVDPAFRRRGVGQALLLALIERLRAFKIHKLVLEVAAGNVDAMQLYQRHGFHQKGLRKAYYARKNAPAEDALILQLELK